MQNRFKTLLSGQNWRECFHLLGNIRTILYFCLIPLLWLQYSKIIWQFFVIEIYCSTVVYIWLHCSGWLSLKALIITTRPWQGWEAKQLLHLLRCAQKSQGLLRRALCVCCREDFEYKCLLVELLEWMQGKDDGFLQKPRLYYFFIAPCYNKDWFVDCHEYWPGILTMILSSFWRRQENRNALFPAMV